MSGVAVVTGAARNLGAAIAVRLASDGFDVVVNTRSDVERAESVAEEVRRLGVRALAIAADVTDPDAVADMFARAADLGPLRVVVHNAGLRSARPVGALSVAEWRAVRDVVLDGGVHCALTAVPVLQSTGGGRIVTILGGHALRGDAERVHLSAAKHGLWGLTLALAAAGRDCGVTANAVSPTGMRTDHAQDLRDRRMRVADVVAFLASDRAASVTGQLIEVDGRGVTRTIGGER